jgi:RHS repeat-associated protein
MIATGAFRTPARLSRWFYLLCLVALLASALPPATLLTLPPAAAPAAAAARSALPAPPAAAPLAEMAAPIQPAPMPPDTPPSNSALAAPPPAPLIQSAAPGQPVLGMGGRPTITVRGISPGQRKFFEFNTVSTPYQGCYRVLISPAKEPTSPTEMYIVAYQGIDPNTGRPRQLRTALAVFYSPLVSPPDPQYDRAGLETDGTAVLLPDGSTASGGIGVYDLGYTMTMIPIADLPQTVRNGYLARFPNGGPLLCALPVPIAPRLAGQPCEPPACSTIGQAISLIDGRETMRVPALGLGGAGLPINVGVRFDSQMWAQGLGSSSLGRGWVASYTRSLRYGPAAAECADCASGEVRYTLHLENGSRYQYRQTGATTFEPVDPTRNATTLTRDATSGVFTLRYQDGMIDQFDASGFLIRVRDRWGNETQVSWSVNTAVTPNVGTQQLRNSRTGQALLLEHEQATDPDSNQTVWRLRRIRDAATNGGTQRTVTLGYGISGEELARLRTISDPGGRVHTFEYDAQGRVDAYFDPNNDPATVATPRATRRTYDGVQVSRETLANGTTIDTYWSSSSSAITTTPAGTVSGEPASVTVWYGHAVDQQITSRSIPNNSGIVSTYTYNSAGQLETETDPLGRRTRYIYEPTCGTLTEIRSYKVTSNYDASPANYDATTLQHNCYGQRTYQRDPAGAVTRWNYDAATGALTSIVRETSGSSQTTTFVYDPVTINGVSVRTGLLTKMILPDGTRMTQSYDSRGYPDLTIYDANVDGLTGRLALTEDADYDWRGFLTAMTDLQGVRTTYEYTQNAATGAFGNLGMPSASVRDAATGGRAVRSEYQYDRMLNLTRMVADAGAGRRNATWQYQYDVSDLHGAYLPTQTTDPLGQIVRTAYTHQGDLKTVTEVGVLAGGGSRVTTWEYTTQEGWLQRVRLHDGRIAQTYSYNSDGQPSAIVDARGVRTELTYDARGRVAEVRGGAAAIGTQPAINSLTTYSYDANDRVVRIDETVSGTAQRTVVQRVYDAYNRLASERDGLGNQTTYSYDDATTRRNFLTLVTRGDNVDAQQRQTQYAYDALGRIITLVEDPGAGRQNLTTRYRYTATGSTDRWNLQELQDSRGLITGYRYNSLGLLSQVTDAASSTWSYTYDNLGALTGITDPRGGGSNTGYTTDLLGRTTALTRNGQTERWAYNVDGTLRQHTDIAARVTAYSYDSTGRLVGIDRNGANADASFSYSANDLLLSATSKPDGVTDETTAYDYDALNRLVRRTRPVVGGSLNTLSYSYNQASDRTGLTYGTRGTVSAGYDAAGRQTSLAPWGAAATTYSYRATDTIGSIARPNGITTSGGYDSATRLSDLTHALGTTAIQPIGYPGRDASSNVTQMTDGNGATSYAYDALNRVTSASYPAVAGGPAAGTSAFSYDASGNRTAPLSIPLDLWAYDFGDYNRDGKQDLYVIKRGQTASGKTEVSVLNGADNFQTFLAQTATVFGATDADDIWSFAVGDYNSDGTPDIYLIKKASTGTGKTEVHVLNGANNFQSYLLQIGSVLGPTGADSTWVFALGHYNLDGKPDLYAIKRAQNTSGKTEVSVLNGADNFQTLLTQTATILGTTGNHNLWAFEVGDHNGDGRGDIYAIQKALTASGKTDLYVLDAAANYQSYALTTATPLGITGNDTTWSFAVGDHNGDGRADLGGIKRQNTGTAKTEAHIMNAAGNYQSWLVQIGTALGYSATTVNLSRPATYNAADLLTTPGAALDGVGNLAYDGSTVYQYDAANRLIRSVVGASTISYQYDALGNLIRQSQNGITTDLVWDEAGSLPLLVGEVGSNGSELLYAHGPDGFAAQRRVLSGAAQGVVYPLLDELGSVRELTNSSGARVRSVVYDAYGRTRSQSGAEPTTLGFTGERQNPDGTIYLRARVYHPSMGRFLQRDTFAGFLDRPQSLNRFAYAENNPVNLVDPSGHSPCPGNAAYDECLRAARQSFGRSVAGVAALAGPSMALCAQQNPPNTEDFLKVCGPGIPGLIGSPALAAYFWYRDRLACEKHCDDNDQGPSGGSVAPILPRAPTSPGSRSCDNGGYVPAPLPPLEDLARIGQLRGEAAALSAAAAGYGRTARGWQLAASGAKIGMAAGIGASAVLGGVLAAPVVGGASAGGAAAGGSATALVRGAALIGRGGAALALP